MVRHLNQTHQHRCTTSIAAKPVEVYKSPRHKLVRFFEKSRNQWKAKYLNAKAIVKRLQNRIRFLEKSKDRLKHRVSELEAELNALKRLLQAKDHELDQLKKGSTAPLVVHQGIDTFRQRIPRHTYSVGHVMWFVSLVLQASSSLRGASQAIAMTMTLFHLPYAVPNWSTGRLWLLRLGYYKLTRAKERADDWAWIVDHTVQMGQEKCLVILARIIHPPLSPGQLTLKKRMDVYDSSPNNPFSPCRSHGYAPHRVLNNLQGSAERQAGAAVSSWVTSIMDHVSLSPLMGLNSRRSTQV